MNLTIDICFKRGLLSASGLEYPNRTTQTNKKQSEYPLRRQHPVKRIAHTLRIVCFVALFLTSVLHAQLTTATLVGTVTDPTGAAVPGARVTVVNLDTHFTSTVPSNANGDYRVDLLPVGTYSMTVETAGFKKFIQTNITLTVNQQVHVDASLALGASTETITITEAPPEINLENATVGRTIDVNEVNDLPIVDRNVYSLLPLVPGVQSNTAGNTLGYPQQVVQINGSTTENNTGAVSYYLDGGLDMTAVRMTGNQLPNPEALAEFNVQTSNYNASYGRMSSGVVSAITKSGTNQFHGALYEFHRETNFGSDPWAPPYPYTTTAPSRSPVHRNFYGGVLGGPIRKDRTFFFFDYSGFRDLRSSRYSNSILPTTSGGTTGKGQIAGDFSALLPTSSGTITSCTQTLSAADKAAGNVVVCNPTTRKPYAGNIITDTLDPVALNILKAIPSNTTTQAGPSYIGYVSAPASYNEYMGKIDHQLTKNQRLTASYFYLNGQNTVPQGSSVPWVSQAQKYDLHVANLSDTYTISANKVNQAWLTYTRSIGGRINSPGKSLTDFGSSFAGQGQLSPPQISVTGYFTLSNAIMGPNAGTNFYSFRDLFILNKGNHALSLGGEASLNKDVQLTDLNNYGVWGFASSTTARTGNALSDYLLGLANSQTQDAPVYAIDNSFFWSLFAQDDWHIRRNLTFNIGVRWDIQTPPTDPQNKESTFIQGAQSTTNPLMPAGELVVGDAGVTRGIVPTRYQHISPRLGFAWDPFGNGKTSVRGGAGVFWGGVSGNEWNSTSNYYPFTLRYTFGVPGTLSNPYKNTPSPFPFNYTPGKVAAAAAGTAIFGMAPNFQWPYTYQVTAAVQQQFSKASVLSIAYVGSLARDLPWGIDKNYPVFNAATPTANTTTNINARRPIDTGLLGAINYEESAATSNYNAMQVTFTQRMTKGISIRANYSWTKTMESYGLDSGSIADGNNLALEKGPTNTDQRNLFVATATWKIDYFKRNRYLDAAIDGWTLTPIVKLYSGSPFTVNTATDNNQDGNSPDRANQIANPFDSTITHGSRSKEIYRWFNPAAFCSYTLTNPTACPGTGPAGSDGTSRRNGYYGPAQRDVDLAVLRDFRLYEGVKLQIRGEATNVFNLVSLNGPNGAINISGATNQITSAAQMRLIQVGARLTF